MWGSLKELLKGCAYNNNIYREIQSSNIIHNNIYKMANTFNRHFVDSLLLNIEDIHNMDLKANKYTDREFEIFSEMM